MKKKKRDEVLEEFETKDLGEDIRKSNSGIWIRRKSQPTSILLPEKMIDELKTKAAKKGIGYQTLLKMIVTENLSRY